MNCSRSWYLIGGGALNFAIRSMRSNCLLWFCWLMGPSPNCSSPPPENRSFFPDCPFSSDMVRPALGTFFSASFSERSIDRKEHTSELQSLRHLVCRLL